VRRPRRTWCAALAWSALVLVAGCTSSDPAEGARPTGPSGTEAGRESAQADVAGLVDLGNGRSIHMECRGSGGPTVILVAGLGERADTWMATSDDPSSSEGSVFPGVAGFTRVCAYDRPGTATAGEAGLEPSRSTPVAQPATVGDSAADLDRLLVASGEPGPYVLVGHSLGGPIVRLYAAAHPAEVAGLVLEDALSEDLGDGLTAAQVASFEALNDPVSQGRPAGSEESFYTAAVVPLLRAAPPAPEVPTVILTADQWPFTAEVIDSGRASGAIPEFVTLEFTDALWTAQLAAQNKLAAMFPGAEHVTETHAGHYIHLDNPMLVITSIRDVVDQERSEPPR
jgi:pimeloyl-ACP methyl ester carboxylesterase